MIRRALPPLLLVAALLGAWELYTDSGGVDAFVLPAPHAIAAAGFDNTGLLLSNLAVTAREVGLGIALAFVIGFALAVAIHFSVTLRRAVYPLAVGSQAVPIVIFAPLLVFWWGFGLLPKLAVIGKKQMTTITASLGSSPKPHQNTSSGAKITIGTACEPTASG